MVINKSEWKFIAIWSKWSLLIRHKASQQKLVHMVQMLEFWEWVSLHSSLLPVFLYYIFSFKQLFCTCFHLKFINFSNRKNRWRNDGHEIGQIISNEKNWTIYTYYFIQSVKSENSNCFLYHLKSDLSVFD